MSAWLQSPAAIPILKKRARQALLLLFVVYLGIGSLTIFFGTEAAGYFLIVGTIYLVIWGILPFTIIHVLLLWREQYLAKKNASPIAGKN